MSPSNLCIWGLNDVTQVVNDNVNLSYLLVLLCKLKPQSASIACKKWPLYHLPTRMAAYHCFATDWQQLFTPFHVVYGSLYHVSEYLYDEHWRHLTVSLELCFLETSFCQEQCNPIEIEINEIIQASLSSKQTGTPPDNVSCFYANTGWFLWLVRQTLRKFWLLELFRWDLYVIWHFFGGSVKKPPCTTEFSSLIIYDRSGIIKYFLAGFVSIPPSIIV